MKEETINFSELAHFTPRQMEAVEAVKKSKYVLYGGAKGGGKSYWLRWMLVALLMKWAREGHKKVRVGLFCEDYPALKDRQITKLASEFPVWMGTLGDSQIEGMSFKLAERYGGGIIALRNLDDPSKYASSEFAAAAMDEVTKNSREKFDQLRSIIRWPGIEDTKWIGGTNPGGIGHEWVKKIFIDRNLGDEDPEPEQVAFVKSLPLDNPYNAKTYLEELQKLPEKLRKAYWDGNWDVFEGQYFSEWNREVHVTTPFQIPLGWRKFRAYDHGRDAPACCLWFAVDYDGRVWVYRELYVTGKNIDQIAHDIVRLSHSSECSLLQELNRLFFTQNPEEKLAIANNIRNGLVACSGMIGCEQYDYSIADPAIFAKHGFVDAYGGQTIAETFARYGVAFIPASNRRIDGWNLMHQYLYTDEHRLPKLIFFQNCTNSTRTIPSLIHDEHKPEDIDTAGEDHAGDTTRYFLLSLHERNTQRPKNHIELKLEQMKRQQSPATNFNKFYYGS